MEERERERGKKNSKTFFFPYCTSKEEEEECRSKHHCFGLLLLFLVFSPILYGDPKMGNNNSYAKVLNH
jgi:hypothetical protein